MPKSDPITIDATEKLVGEDSSVSSQSGTTASVASTASHSSTPFGTNRPATDRRQPNRDPTLFEKLFRRCTVFWVALRVFGDYKWAGWRAKRVKRRLGLSPEDPDSDDHPDLRALWADVHARNAAYLLSNIRSLAGFWVKVGQYLSTRADVLPAEYCRRLAALQDSMPPKPFADVRATLEEELDAASLAGIESIDPAPLSTASLAQVHTATLKPGAVVRRRPGSGGRDDDDGDYRHEVVLKVQHRGVASLMLQDMENLRVILELLARSDPDLDFGPVIREYNQEVRKELDFRTEARNMAEVKRLLRARGVPAIVPEPIEGLVRERVLVMDYCEGFAVKDAAAMDRHGVDRELLLERICRAWALQMHVGGFFNADPHAGNILVSTRKANVDASVPVLLDFGLTKRLDPTIKLAFARLMHASYEGDVDGLMTSFVEMGLKLNRHDPMEDLANMQRGFGDTVPQEEALQVQKQKRQDYQTRNQARRDEAGLKKGEKLRNPVEAWPSELVFFGRVTNMLRGLCSQLNVRYPYLKTMAAAARETLQESVPKEEHAAQLIHPSSQRVTTRLQRRLVKSVSDLDQEGQFVGLQICVLKDGIEMANVAAGTLGVANPRPVTPASLVNVFSVSKGVLSIAVLRLVQDGTIRSLDDPVGEYWPAFGATKPNITVRHLLTHTAGLANAYPVDATLDTLLDWEGMVDFMAHEAEPSHEPGAETQYHALTFAWLVGGLIEQATGQPYEILVEQVLFEAGIDNTSNHGPRLFLAGISEAVDDASDLTVLSMDKRGMSSSASSPPSSNNNQLGGNDPSVSAAKGEATPALTTPKRQGKQSLAKYRGLQQLMNPTVFNMRKVREAKLPSANGHASAESLARLFAAVVRNDDPLLAPEILEQARAPQRTLSEEEETHATKPSHALLNDARSRFGLGFQLHDLVRSDCTNNQTATTIGHSGVGGNLVLAIPEERVVVALTFNRIGFDPQIARQTLLGIVLDELGWEAPASLPVTMPTVVG